MKTIYKFLIAFVILAVAIGLACKEPTRPKTGADVEFVRWSTTCGGGSGFDAVGWVKNTGNRSAMNVIVKSSVDGRTLISATTPVDLDPGEQGSFFGPCSGPGVIKAPSIDWIHWD
jgi:hypothetical protein